MHVADEREAADRQAGEGAGTGGDDPAAGPLSDAALGTELMALLPVGVVVHRRDGSIVDANPAAEGILGLSRSQMLGLAPPDPRWASVHRDGTPWPGTDHPAMRVLRTGDPCDGLMGVDAPPRGRVWLQVHAVGHRPDADGLPQLAVATFIDVTRRVRAEDEAEARRQELQRRTEEVQRLHAVVAHDLRTPLTAVRGYTDLLLRRGAAALPEQPQEWLGAVDRAARRLEQMFDGLLAVARVGARPLVEEAVDLDEVLDGTLEALAVAGHDLAVTRSPLGPVQGDAVLLTQLVDNLVGNAVKYAADDAGRVPLTVSAQPREDGRTDLVVADHGPGIPEGSREQALRLFERVDERRRATGSGVGLSVCADVAERHGGTLALEETPGGGLTVRVDLPRPAPSSGRPTRG